MPEKTEPCETDIVLDTPQYGVRCVICGDIEVANKDGPFIRTFSFGDAENTVYCSGVMFLCKEHQHDDMAVSALLAKIAMLAAATGVYLHLPRGARA